MFILEILDNWEKGNSTSKFVLFCFSAQQMQSYSYEQVSKHNNETSNWIIVDNEVFDVSKFLEFHPGGKQILLQHAGKDVTEIFHMYHNPSVLIKYRNKFKIGEVSDYQAPNKIPVENAFGDLVPFGDPIWYQRLKSPYYKDTHIQFRSRIREFVEKEIMPTLNEWKDNPRPPKDIYLKMGAQGFLACMVGPPFPKDYVDPGTPFPEDFDYFHEFILYDELARCGHAAAIGALSNGPAIAISALYRFGSEEQKRKWIPDILMGRKFCALAVSEPGAGSDVAALQCTALLHNNGKEFIVNGNKKWITNGMYSDLFVTAVVTGSKGHSGLSLLLVPSDTVGFSTRKVDIRGSDVSGTAYLDFDQALVPVSNLIGNQGDGWKYIMYNFNHERFYVTAIMSRLARVCLEESIRYAMKRKTFGKFLYEHQAIRMKIASMTRRCECLHAWLESVVFNMCQMSHEEASLKLGDVIALLKAEGSRVYEHCARETTMIFGGNALYSGGVGDKIEPAVTQVKGYQIPAGAEDVMDDFGARTIFKLAKLVAKL